MKGAGKAQSIYRLTGRKFVSANQNPLGIQSEKYNFEKAANLASIFSGFNCAMLANERMLAMADERCLDLFLFYSSYLNSEICMYYSSFDAAAVTGRGRSYVACADTS